MLDVIGPVPLVVLSRLLALAVLAPVLGAIAALWLGRPGAGTGTTALAWAAKLPAVTALGVAFLSLAELGSMPTGYRLLFGGALPLVRVGSLDASLGLSLDGLSAPAFAVAAGLLLATQAWGVKKAPRAAFVAASNALGAASFLVLLADGTPTLVVGFALEGLALVLLAATVEGDSGTPFSRMGAAAAVGQVALVLASAIAFWGSGGSFTREGYVADSRSRLAAIDQSRTKTMPKGIGVEDEAQAPGGKRVSRAEQGALTVLALPGSTVYLDGSATPVGTTPFVRRGVDAGSHSAHLVAGGGSDDLDLGAFRVFAGSEVTLSVIAPATTFRDLTTVMRARDQEGPFGVASRLAAPTKGGSPLTWLMALLGVAALGRAGSAAASRDEAPGRVAVTVALPLLSAAYAVARFSLALGAESVALVALGALFACALGVAAFRAERPAAVVALATAAHAGVAVAAAAARAPIVGMFHMTAAVTAGALSLWALQAKLDGPAPRSAFLVRAGAACLGVVPPGVGIAWTALDALRLASSQTTSVLIALGLVGTSLGAAAVWRVGGALAPEAAPTPVTAKAETPAKKGKKKKDAAAKAEATSASAAPSVSEDESSVASGVALALLPVAALVGFFGSTSVMEGSLARLAQSAAADEPARTSLGATPLVLSLALLVVAGIAWTRSKAPEPGAASPRALDDALASISAALSAVGRLANGLDGAVARATPAPGARSEDAR